MRVFVDTGALLALHLARDQYHRRAVALARREHASGSRYVGTTLVLTEFHTHLLYSRGSRDALAAVTKLLDDPAHEWFPVSAKLISDAKTNWLARFADQSLSMVDAVSFEVMTQQKLTHAFAFDQHFETAGFELLR